MAKKAGGVNKADEVRKYLAEHPAAPNREVVEALGKRGIKIPANYPSIVKSNMKGRPAAAGGSSAAPAHAPVHAVSGGNLRAQLVQERQHLERRLTAIKTLLE